MKNILYLLMGMSICSCGKSVVDYNMKGEFIYYNRLATPIQLHIRNGLNKAKEDHIIDPGGSFTIHTSGESHNPVANPAGYVPGITADTAIIQFNDTLCYTEYREGAWLHNINKYKSNKRGDADYVFSFDIDSNLVNLAHLCPDLRLFRPEF